MIFLTECHLTTAQLNIEAAYSLLMQGQAYWLNHLNTAIEQMDIVESLILHVMDIECIQLDDAPFILQSIQDIRANIILLIEYSNDYFSS